jgi:iduronate 2-sulfatase
MYEVEKNAGFSRPAPVAMKGVMNRIEFPFGRIHRARALACALTLALILTASIASAATARIKNVLFLISDDLKASTLGCYGDPFVRTPNIDALATQGMVFNRAYCQGTSCGPSRTSFMHSRYRNGSGINMGQHFREQGWHTARVGKIYHMRVPGDIIAGTHGQDIASSWTERFNSKGLEAHTPGDYACLNLNIFSSQLEGRQSTRMPHRPYVTVRYEGNGSDQPDHKTATKTIELLREHKDKPFFLAAGFVRPHYPMIAPHQYFDSYPWEKMKLPEVAGADHDDIPKSGIAGSTSKRIGIDKFPDNQKRMWAGYYASIQFMDEQVGRVVRELDRLGLRDSTAIVFCSDHGYHLGEHHFWQKSNLHEEVLRVPLIMSIPGMKPGRSDSLVELMDIYPTLADLAGVTAPKAVQGKSLRPVLADPKATVRKAALSVGSKGYAMRAPDWAYIRYHDQSEELYDMKADPKQFVNLAKDPTSESEIGKLRRHLDERLKEADLSAPKHRGRKGKKKK